MEYNEAVEYLRNSLIYQMSLGSKELFHSNVWWWLIENDKNFIRSFIPNFEPSKYHNSEYIWAKREERNRDILIWLEEDNGKKSHLVIENKIKTLPTTEQLKDYTMNLGENAFIGGVLTGIGDCLLDSSELNGINGVIGKWSYVSYKEIANRILEIALISTSDSIIGHIEQIKEYCNIINCLNLILEENLNKNKNALSFDCDYDSLNNLRIADIFKKHKGSHFLNYIKAHNEELEAMKPNGYNLIICQSFNNGKTTLDIRFSNWVDGNTPYNLLGVQIEGDQFRIVAEKNAHPENINSDLIYNELKDCWFDDSYDKNSNRFIFGNKSTMKPHNGKKYDTYNTNGYCFVYQSRYLIELKITFLKHQ